MPIETEMLCEVWEEEKPIISPPSRLFHLKPIGIGTPLVESLTSYLSRLANEHSVLLRTLVIDEILPNLPQSHLYKENRPIYDHLTTFWKRSTVLNGNCSTASIWVQTVEHLTQRSDLHLLTMLAFGKVLSCRGLVRRTQAWCPACYEEWREAEHIIYQPLLWQLSAIAKCPRHNTPLLLRCPYRDCGRTLPHLAPRFQVGFCTHCVGWLGRSTFPTTPQSCTKNQQEWLSWVGQAVGELLVAAESFSNTPCRPEVIATLISTHVDGAMEGNFSEFARQVRFHRRTVWEWAQGSQIPQLDALLQICSYFGTSPVHLLSKDFQGNVQPQQHIRDMGLTREQPKRPLRSFRKFEAERLGYALKQVLCSEEYPPPSMQKVAKLLSYDQSHLRKHFPDLCRAISARYRAYQKELRRLRRQRLCNEVRQIANTLSAQGYFPSERQIGKRLPSRGMLKEAEVRTALYKIRSAREQRL